MGSRCLSSLTCSTSPRCALEYSSEKGQIYILRRSLARHLFLKGSGRFCGLAAAPWPSTKRRCKLLGSAATWIGNENGRENGRDHLDRPENIAGATCSQLEDSRAVVCTQFVAETLLPTRSGKFRLRGYRHSVHRDDGSVTVSEPSVLLTGQPEGLEEVKRSSASVKVVVRVHDACFTSEVLGSLKCDCADQLQLAMDYIQENPGGIIIYLQQEGRGIGLANKIAAYALQEQGLDTVDANRQLGFPDDAREYTSVLNILADLDIKSIKLMTNNPRKIEVLESLGVRITQRIPCIVEAQKHNLGYLVTKTSRMRHLLELDQELDGSYCIWNHGGEPLQASILPATSLKLNSTKSEFDSDPFEPDSQPAVPDKEQP